MSETCDSASLPSDEMKIVPRPHHDEGWAVVNRRGDVLAGGSYAHCIRRLRRMTAPAA